MVKIVWSKHALKDLNAIYEFIREDSELYAKRFTEKIINRISQLEAFPELGRVVPEFEDETIRELIEGNYRIVYQVRQKSIIIVRIHHAARQLKK